MRQLSVGMGPWRGAWLLASSSEGAGQSDEHLSVAALSAVVVLVHISVSHHLFPFSLSWLYGLRLFLV